MKRTIVRCARNGFFLLVASVLTMQIAHAEKAQESVSTKSKPPIKDTKRWATPTEGPNVQLSNPNSTVKEFVKVPSRPTGTHYGVVVDDGKGAAPGAKPAKK